MIDDSWHAADIRKGELRTLEARVSSLNRCIDTIRDICEDERGSVQYRLLCNTILDEIAAIGPMYERGAVQSSGDT